MDKIEYNKLRLDVLIDLTFERGIECKPTKHEIVRCLELDDAGKYVRETVYEKYMKNQYIIGIDPRNHKDLMKVTKLVINGEAKNLKAYYDNRLHYIIDKKLDE